ncbi:hypothetical protein [Streptomyces sp. NBC_00645]|uniref:hypothetical protein n=1 Tax=Streptomyces sp. NBC_00645 TaxID=2975795 RepID=UPI003251086B
MQETTHTTAPAPTTQPDARVPAPPTDPARAAYQRASALADRIVAQLTVLPHAIEQYEGGGAYSIRFHFGRDLAAGRGVLEVAGLADAEVVKDPAARAGTCSVFIETRTVLEGIGIIARAELPADDAAQLDGDPSPDTEAEQPIASAEPPIAEPAPSVVPITAPVTDAEQPSAPARVQRLGSPLMHRISVAPAADGQA